jgi:hypothetical protein
LLQAFLLHIAGYEWDFKEELTPRAIKNLELAFDFLTKHLTHNEEILFDKIVLNAKIGK